MSVQRRYTSRDLEKLPNVEGTRYEIIDGELHVSKQPSLEHQYVCLALGSALHVWSLAHRTGRAYSAPGLVFAEDDDVATDLIWISDERLAEALDDAGHLRVAPELVVEVLSPGARNQRRDREVKLALYSRRGAEEYWIVDCRLRTVQVFRRAGPALEPVSTCADDDVLASPVLPGFSCPLADLWWARPPGR
jgi:Uma2 family endonuclease